MSVFLLNCPQTEELLAMLNYTFSPPTDRLPSFGSWVSLNVFFLIHVIDLTGVLIWFCWLLFNALVQGDLGNFFFLSAAEVL